MALEFYTMRKRAALAAGATTLLGVAIVLALRQTSLEDQNGHERQGANSVGGSSASADSAGECSPLRTSPYREHVDSDSQKPVVASIPTVSALDPFEFRTKDGRDCTALLSEFIDMPEYRGTWPLSFGRVESAGPDQLYSWDPAVIDQAIELQVQFFYDQYVAPYRPASERHTTPRVEDWQRFANWLRDAYRVIAMLTRRHAQADEDLRRPDLDTVQRSQIAEGRSRIRAVLKDVRKALSEGQEQFWRGTFGRSDKAP